MTRFIIFMAQVATILSMSLMESEEEATSWMDFDYTVPDTATGSVIIIY